MRAKRSAPIEAASRVCRDPTTRAALGSLWQRKVPSVVSTLSLQRLAQSDHTALFNDVIFLAQAASANSLGQRTRITYNSQVPFSLIPCPNLYSPHPHQVRYFIEFCSISAIDAEAFGLRAIDGGLNLAEEESLLCLFATYVVYYPRVDTSRSVNTAAYAEGCLSAVRSWVYEGHQRYPGPATADAHTLRHVIKGLHKIAPSGVYTPRLPILREHLLAIRDLLDLVGSQRDRVLWAFYLTCWVGVCRAGDLILPKRSSRSSWDPQFETHCGRLQRARVPPAESPGGVPRERYELRLKPTKTDPTGEKNFTKTFLTDPDPDALSAGNALRDMVLGITSEAPLTEIPLFTDPRTGVELTYETASGELRRLLTASGYPELARGTHSLRIGGATSAASVGGEYVAGCMGLWSSTSRHRYLWAMRGQIEQAAVSMGTTPLGPLARRPGPVFSYSRTAS
jgi:hypothetical protein